MKVGDYRLLASDFALRSILNALIDLCPRHFATCRVARAVIRSARHLDRWRVGRTCAPRGPASTRSAYRAVDRSANAAYGFDSVTQRNRSKHWPVGSGSFLRS